MCKRRQPPKFNTEGITMNSSWNCPQPFEYICRCSHCYRVEREKTMEWLWSTSLPRQPLYIWHIRSEAMETKTLPRQLLFLIWHNITNAQIQEYNWLRSSKALPRQPSSISPIAVQELWSKMRFPGSSRSVSTNLFYVYGVIKHPLGRRLQILQELWSKMRFLGSSWRAKHKIV